MSKETDDHGDVDSDDDVYEVDGTRVSFQDGTPDQVRRRFLGALAAGGVAAVAGCLDGDDDDDDPVDDDDDDPVDDDDEDVDDEDEDVDDEDEDDDEDAQTYEVEFLEEEETVDIAEDEFLLMAGEDAGLDLPYQCREGFCGECQSQVDGDASEVVEMDGNEYLEDEDIEDGYLLTCVGQPRDDFALDTDPDERV